jgi:hypothetical protein
MNAADLPLKGLQRTFVECSLYLPPIIVVYSNDIIRLLVLPPFVPKVSKMDVFIYIYTRQGNTSIIEAPFLWSGCGRVV